MVRTHVVTNVVPAPSGLHVLRSDPALAEAVERWVTPHDPPGAAALDDLGALAGTEEARTWADQADRVTPVLRTHAPTGERVDTVEFHPAYHSLVSLARRYAEGAHPVGVATLRLAPAAPIPAPGTHSEPSALPIST